MEKWVVLPVTAHLIGEVHSSCSGKITRPFGITFYYQSKINYPSAGEYSVTCPQPSLLVKNMQNNYEYGEMFCDDILTSYRIYGDPTSSLIPLVILHGGPSGGFDYLLNYHELSDDGRRVVFYDQFGCGRSTHFPMANASFWTIERYLQQLQQLINHLGIGERYSLLGHSRGGMLAAEHACSQPKGLHAVIYASSPASIPLWQSEVLRLVNAITEVTDDVLDDSIMQARIYQHPPEQLVAYYAKHVYTTAEEPLHIQRSNAQFAADQRLTIFFGVPMSLRYMAYLNIGTLPRHCIRFCARD